MSVDGLEYGTVDMPDKGLSFQATNLKSSAGSRWAEGSKNAPFDKEVFVPKNTFLNYFVLPILDCYKNHF